MCVQVADLGISNHLVVVVGCVFFKLGSEYWGRFVNWYVNLGVKIGEDFDQKWWGVEEIKERRNNIYINREISIEIDEGLCKINLLK